MSEAETTPAAAPKKPAAPVVVGPAYSRKTLKKKGRDKRKAKILGDREFAKAYFGARSKRSTDKKAAFRKKKKGKK